MTETTSTGLGITTSRKIRGGTVVEEKVVVLPTIEEIREKLSFKGEEKEFWWRGGLLASGTWNSKTKVYTLSNQVFDEMEFPTWQKAFDFLDAEKSGIAMQLEALTTFDEDE